MKNETTYFDFNSPLKSGTVSHLTPITRVTSPQKPNWLLFLHLSLLCVHSGDILRKASRVHCPSAFRELLLRALASIPTTLCHFGVCWQAEVSRQGEGSDLATSFWGLWNPSRVVLPGASTVTCSAPWLRIPNWSFSCCLYTKFSYENLSNAFSH